MTSNQDNQVGDVPGGDDAPTEAERARSATTDPGPRPEPDIDLTITDGRHRRSARSRAAIVDALLDLLREGVDQPSSTQIAERAGVTQRTLFNQFGDMQGVLEALWERQIPRVAVLVPATPTGSHAERADGLAAGLAILLEDVSPVRWALLTHSALADIRTEVVERFNQLVRGLLTATFGRELDRLDDDVLAVAMDALLVACDPATWRLRRLLHGQSVDRATAALAAELGALTGLPVAARPHGGADTKMR